MKVIIIIMKLITIVSLTITSVFCYGQSEREKPVYSISKDAPVIDEHASELKMDAAEKQMRSSFSANKSQTVTLPISDKSSHRDSSAVIQKIVTPATIKKEIEVPRK